MNKLLKVIRDNWIHFIFLGYFAVVFIAIIIWQFSSTAMYEYMYEYVKGGFHPYVPIFFYVLFGVFIFVGIVYIITKLIKNSLGT